MSLTELNIQNCALASWQQVALKSKKSVVFVDNSCGECLHWVGGGMLLFDNGSIDIREFSSFESGKEDQKKAMFILSCPILDGLGSQIIQDILQASSFQYVVLITTLSPAMHSVMQYGPNAATENDQEIFGLMEEQILQWMGNLNYTVEIEYHPLLIAPITSKMFILPAQANLFPLLRSDITLLQKTHFADKLQKGEPAPDIDFGHLSKGLQLQLKLLASSLNSLMEQWKVTEDLYYIGPTCAIVAGELANLPWARARRKSAQHKITLVLADRSLDVASCSNHGWDSMLDAILAALPRLPNHHADVCVNMAPVCAVSSECKPGVIVPGCLGHSADPLASSLLENLAFNKQKEGLMAVNRALVEAASKEKLPLNLTAKPSRVTLAQLQSNIGLFKGKTEAVRHHSGLLQIGLAVVEASTATTQHDSLLGVEKGLLQSLGDAESITPLEQLSNNLLTQAHRKYSLSELALLLIYIYSMAGEELSLSRDEYHLQNALEQVMLDTPENQLPEWLKYSEGARLTKEEITRTVDTMFERLRSLGIARERLRKFRYIYQPGTVMLQGSAKPIFKQIVSSIFHADRPDLPDIKYQSSGFKDLLKTGFGLFKNHSNPHPADNPVFVIFVIGGITCTEVKQIKEAVAALNDHVQVLVGGTTVVESSNLLHQVLFQNNLDPSDSAV